MGERSALAPMLAHVALGVGYFLTAQRVLDMRLVAPSAQPLTGMIYLADASSAWTTALWTRVRGDGSSVMIGRVPRVAWALPAFDLIGLTCAFEAMRVLGGPMYQTISGLLIPLSAALSGVFLGRRFTMTQMTAIAVVVCGLAVKAADVRESAARAGTETPTTGVVFAAMATVAYGFRGLVMEYLTVTGSGMSGNSQTMLIGTCGLIAFTAYTLARTARDVDGMIWAYYSARPRDLREVVVVHLGNMLSRAFMVKMMMVIVTRVGSTQLALSNAIRSVGVITFSHILFCGGDARQCLNRNGAISAAMVVSGGLAYALSAPSKTSAKKDAKKAAPTSKSTTRADVADVPRAASVRRRSARRG